MILSSLIQSQAQVALKTNIISDAFLSPNGGIEFRLAKKWSLDVTGQFNVWNWSDGRRTKHWLAQPEARYWLCDALSGHFFGLNALGGQYNFGHLGFARDVLGINFGNLRDHRYQGWYAGAGLAYGYSWILGKHWNLEAEIGVGWIYTKYDVFECEGCGKRTGNGKKNVVLPTKAAINLVYLF